MKKYKSLIVILICLAVLLGGCKGSGTGEETSDTTTPEVTSAVSQNILKLPYSNKDSLNPFLGASEVNYQLSELMYQSLYTLNENYEPIAEVALSGSVNGPAISVTLGSFVFSDGSSLSSSDVVYSFNKAKSSTSYANLLSNISSAKAEGTGAVSFKLVTDDIFALSALTFPIVKNGTAEKSDSVPVGSGPYILGEDNSLNINSSYRGTATKIQKIQLVDVSNAVNESYVLQTGDISFCFDALQSGVYTKINAVTNSVLLNNLVFVGINSGNLALSNPNVRLAIASAIDISKITVNAYQGNAVGTRLPFNPNWSKMVDVSVSLNAASSVSLLEKDGYNKLDKSGIRTNGTTSLKFSLLVNADNGFRVQAANIIAASLNEIGMNVVVNSVPFADYNALVKSGGFDLYLGEIKLPENMSLGTFFESGKEGAVGINLSSTVVADYASFKNGTITIQGFCDSFMKDIPFIPLCYRTGVVAHLRGLEINTNTPKWYKNIEGWSY